MLAAAPTFVTPDFMSDGGQMGTFMRAHDWASHPLGVPEFWPLGLRIALRIMLTTHQPVFLFWGKESFCFYNDAYSQSLGPEKHPAILGKPGSEAWSEIWSIVRPQVDHVMRGDGATSYENAMIPILRHGNLEQVYWTYSYSPIEDPAAPNGIGGALVICTETTQEFLSEQELDTERQRLVLAEDRRTALIKLTYELRQQKSLDVITYTSAQILGETLKASRVGYGTIDFIAETLNVARDWTAPGIETLAGKSNLAQYGWLIEDLRQGKTVVIKDVETDPHTAHSAGRLKGRSAGSFVNVPVIEEGKLVAMLYVNHATERDWSPEDIAFIREVAERTRTMSERVRSEAALRESEARFRTITDAMPQIVWSTLPDGHHDYYNKRWYEFTGVREGSTDGEGWNALFHPDDQERAWGKWRHSLLTGEAYEIQYRLRHYSGEYRWTLGRALPVRDATGTIVRWMGTCTDIHDQKIAEAELLESSMRKDEFLAMLAHELRNPLAPISSAAQLLRMENISEKQVVLAGDIISRQVRHMTSLVDDLLDVSRVSRGLVNLEMERVDVLQAVSHAIEQARPLVEQRKQALKVRADVERAFVKGDRTRIVQVIANLLNNAAKYTPQGGEIIVTVTAENARVNICVQDNGSGISPKLLPYVFDLFTQGERTPDRAQGGLGLGLALVKSITIKHGGEVSAYSAGPGQGSMFTISLPVMEVQDLQQPRAVREVASQYSLRMMVVDDNVDAASTLATLLELDGHQVRVAVDALSALEAVKHDAPQVFILDIGLPDMDGYELARRLRANPATTDSLIFALSGYGQEHDRVLSKAAGFDHHFVKPLDIEQLKGMFATVRAS